MNPYTAHLLNDIETRFPHLLPGVNESMAVADNRFQEMTQTFLEWVENSQGSGAISAAVDAYAGFTMDVNLAQYRYEKSGSYENKSFSDVESSHYSCDETMHEYLLGVMLSNVLWAHHLDLSIYFEDRFLAALPQDAHFLEIAPGHGAWGLWALRRLQQATLEGFDISAASIEISTGLAKAAGMAHRTRYTRRNALDLALLSSDSFDAAICSFLLEHLEQPEKIFEVIRHVLKPNGLAFVTGALTAAQIDHIFEFRQESELVLMAEQAGLRVIDTRSTNPSRRLPGARFTPRSMALIVRRQD